MFRRWLAVLLLAVVAAGCGGGGASVSSAQGGGAPAALAIHGFAPVSAAAGAEVTVTGAALDTVTSVRIGAVAQPFERLSAGQLRFRVADGTAQGNIELVAAGAAVLSSARFVPAQAPSIAALAPARIAPGAIVTLTGVALDRVQAANLNGVTLVIASRAANRLELEVPTLARSGFIELVAEDGLRYRSALPLEIATAVPSIIALAPSSAMWGQTVRLNGSALAQVVSVVFAGGAAASAKVLGNEAIEAIVPDAARSGVITVVLVDGTRAASEAALEVIEPIRSDAQAIYRSTAVDGTLLLAGSGLANVTAVTIGTAAVQIVGRSNDQLAIIVPAGLACGTITLLAQNQASVAAGTWQGGGGCALRAAGIEFAQVLSQASGDLYQRLVPGRAAWVRAFIVAAAAGQPSPSVRLHASALGVPLGSVSLSGPATLPQLALGVELPQWMRYEQRQSFSAMVPAEWVQPGLEVAIEIDAEARYGAPVMSVQRPVVGATTSIDVVLVPLVSGVHAPSLPLQAEVFDELARKMPVAPQNLRVSIRAPHTLASVIGGVDTVADFSAALRELEALRRAEAPTRVYYGLVKPMQAVAGTEGLGYVNAAGMVSPSLSALGLDASRSRWASILVHELGHLFGRPHAPCGIAGDSDFPYLNGALGPTGLFDALLAQVFSPAGQADVMGYCGGLWFSDYNYRHVQSFLEALPPSVSTTQRLRATADLVVISGVIGSDGVRFAPVRAQRGYAAAATRGAYRLRIETATGVLEVPFDASAVDHVQDERHFFVTVPDPGPITRLQVRQGERVLSSIAARADAATASVQWQYEGEHLQLRWDASVNPYLSLAQRSDTGRRLLLLDATGGMASVPRAQLAADGEFEFSVSDGLNARLLRSAR